MDDHSRPGEPNGVALQRHALAAPPASSELSGTERLLVALIIALAVAAVFLLARTAVLLLWQDFPASWLTGRQSGSDFFIARPFGTGTALVVALCAPFFTLAHEGGHALGGRLAGFWLESIQVGVVKLTRTNRGLKLSLARRKWWAGGSTASHPVGDLNLRPRYAVFVAMGPLTDLVLGLLGAVLARVALAGSAPNAVAAAILTLAGGICCLSFVLNAVPLKLGKAQNDGWYLLQLLLGSQAMERAMVLATLRGYTVREVPAALRSPTLLARAQALASSRLERHLVAIYAYAQAAAMGDFETAGRQLDQAIATVGAGAAASTLAHEAAYFTARHRGQPDGARAWLAYAHGDQFASFMRPRALAAIALAEGRYAEARTQAAEGIIAREAYAHTSGRQYRMEADQLRAMLGEAERALAAPGGNS